MFNTQKNNSKRRTLSLEALEEKIALLKSLNIPYRERTVPVLKLHQIFLDDPNGVVIELNYPAAEKAALDAKAA